MQLISLSDFLRIQIFGFAGVNQQLRVFIDLVTKCSIEKLSFELVKLESGIIAYGYYALILHVLFLLLGCAFCYLAWRSLKKVLNL